MPHDASRSVAQGPDDHKPDDAPDESTEEFIEDLLDRWEESVEAGQPIGTEQLCAEHPSLIGEVRSRIARLQAMDGRLNAPHPGENRSAGGLNLQSSVEELEFLQSGGLGEVYVGEDLTARRPVAVKFLHKHLASDPVYRERFALEAEVTARLEHPGVIPLYGIGQNDEGEPFYAMRFIDGQSMDDLLQELHQETRSRDRRRVEYDRRYRQLLNHFVSVCKTIAYAHNRGIVHRDIKPANVMLGKYGETIVVDWGLAVPVVRDAPFRQSGEKTLMPVSAGDSSSSGHGAGTPAYMSPEQASKLAPTPASDIYSLGATLYKIVAGQSPVPGNSIEEIKTNIIDGRLVPLREVKPKVAPALAAIIDKALALHPAARYATALQMAEDVEAYLSDERVTAYQEPWMAKWLRTARRHRGAMQTALVALVLGSVLAAFAFLTLGAYATRETIQRRKAESAEAKAVEAQENADRLRRESLAKSAQFLAKSIANEIDLRWRLLEAEADSSRLRELMQTLNSAADQAPPDPNRDDGAIDLSKLNPHGEQLQSWLMSRYINNRDAVKTDSWFVQAAGGIQLARVPRGDSIGRNYAHRDYFHGLGRDLDERTVTEIESRPGPLTNRIVHMSAVYESTNTQTLKVTFSVPIHDGEREFRSRKKIGVIGMSIELGDFAMDDQTWLVDTRTDQLNEQRGLLLQHPRLGQRSGDDELPHLDASWVGKMLELRTRRIRNSRSAGWVDPDQNVLSLIDPIDQSPVRAAVEPVIIRGRPDQIADTGWVVVVSESE